MDGKSAKLIFCLLLLFVAPQAAHSAVIELSGTGSYSKSTFADGFTGYVSKERRYSASIEFKFSAVSGIEFQYMNSTSEVSYQTNVGTIIKYYTPINIGYKDEVYSVNWVQNLVPSKWMIQPYVKVGGGRLVRKYSELYPEFGTGQVIQQNSVTGVAAVGLRIFLTRAFALKGELETYVPNFHYSQWQTNETFSAGLSWLF